MLVMWRCLTCLWAIKHHGPGVHIAHFTVDVAHFVVERHGSGLAGLMVLKGIVFGLFCPFHHWMVLKGGAIMTYGLQMSSIPSVDSTVGALDHVRSSTFGYLNHSTSRPLDGACGLLVLEELDLFFHFEGMQISGLMGSVKLFFLFLLQLD